MIWSVSMFSSGRERISIQGYQILFFASQIFLRVSYQWLIPWIRYFSCYCSGGSREWAGKRVLAPGLATFKFLLEVDIAYSFRDLIFVHSEAWWAPGLSELKISSFQNICKSSSIACCSTFLEPGTISAVMFGALYFPWLNEQKPLGLQFCHLYSFPERHNRQDVRAFSSPVRIHIFQRFRKESDASLLMSSREGYYHR